MSSELQSEGQFTNGRVRFRIIAQRLRNAGAVQVFVHRNRRRHDFAHSLNRLFVTVKYHVVYLDGDLCNLSSTLRLRGFELFTIGRVPLGLGVLDVQLFLKPNLVLCRFFRESLMLFLENRLTNVVLA